MNKRMKDILSQNDFSKSFNLGEAIELVLKSSTTKFDETIDISTLNNLSLHFFSNDLSLTTDHIENTIDEQTTVSNNCFVPSTHCAWIYSYILSNDIIFPDLKTISLTLIF